MSPAEAMEVIKEVGGMKPERVQQLEQINATLIKTLRETENKLMAAGVDVQKTTPTADIPLISKLKNFIGGLFNKDDVADYMTWAQQRRKNEVASRRAMLERAKMEKKMLDAATADPGDDGYDPILAKSWSNCDRTGDGLTRGMPR